jgi:hypothetical protein
MRVVLKDGSERFLSDMYELLEIGDDVEEGSLSQKDLDRFLDGNNNVTTENLDIIRSIKPDVNLSTEQAAAVFYELIFNTSFSSSGPTELRYTLEQRSGPHTLKSVDIPVKDGMVTIQDMADVINKMMSLTADGMIRLNVIEYDR